MNKSANAAYHATKINVTKTFFDYKIILFDMKWPEKLQLMPSIVGEAFNGTADMTE